LQYITEIDSTYDMLFRDHAAEAKQAIDTAIQRTLMDLNHKVLARESRPQGTGSFRGV
jgi:hypothetical protein